MTSNLNVLVVAPDLGVELGRRYSPGGLAQFSRCLGLALANSSSVSFMEVWGLLDTKEAVDDSLEPYLTQANPGAEIRVRGFGGDRRRLSLHFLLRHRSFDRVIFLHVGVGRLALICSVPYTIWIIGIEVRRPLKWLESWAFIRSRELLSISEFSYQEFRRWNPTTSKVCRLARVVHLCREPDEAWTAPSQQPHDYAYDSALRSPRVLIVARMSAAERYKGHDQLIECWPEVVSRQPGAELRVVGGGDDADRLRAKAASLPGAAAHSIHFLGKVSHADLLQEYREARLFAMPSLGEGFGLVFVEAMRYGLPCVCSRDSAAEIVVHGETGWVVDQQAGPIGDAISSILENAELANAMSRAGRARMESLFTFEAFRSRLLAAEGLQT